MLEIKGELPGRSVQMSPSRLSSWNADTLLSCLRLVCNLGGSSGLSATIGGWSCLVDRKPLRVHFNRPIIVGIMFCICLRARALVKLSWVVKKPASIALHKVETGGYPAAACRKWFGFVFFLVISTQCNWVGS